MIKILLVPILGTLLFSSCSEKKETTRAQDPNAGKIQVLEARLEELHEENAQERESHRAQIAENALVMSELKSLLATLNEKRASKSEPEPVVVEMTKDEPEVAVLKEKKLAKLDESFRTERLLAQGEKLDLIKTTSGEIYRDVVISEVNDIGISIRHRGGAARIPFEELPASWGERFGYDPLRSEQALKQERIVQAKYRQAASQSMMAQRERTEKLDQELREGRLALALAEANRPAPQPLAGPVNVPDDIPDRQTIYLEPYYYNNFTNVRRQGTLHVPTLQVPSLNPSTCLLPDRRPTVRPPVIRPTSSGSGYNEAVSRPGITRPPATSPSRPKIVTPSQPQISRPAPQPVQRPSRPTQSTVTRQSRMVK